MARATMSYSSDLAHLDAMRAMVGEECRRAWNRPEDVACIQQVQLALNEAAANIMEHAYRGEAGHPIALEVEADADRITLTLYHEGDAFDPAMAPPPVFNGSREGGFGVYMIRRLMDGVSYYRCSDGRNAVRLVKNRTPLARE